MPGRPIRRDVRENTMRMVDARVATLQDLVDARFFSMRTAQRFRKSWLEEGHRLPPIRQGSRRGRPRKLNLWALRRLKALLERDVAMTLPELQRQLELDGHGVFTIPTLSRTLKRLGLSRKRLNKYALQRQAAKRSAYRREIGLYKPKQLVFIDESAVDLRNVQRLYGRSPIGTKAYKAYLLRRGPRYTVLPAVSLGCSPYAVTIKEGSFTGDDFYVHLRDVLLPAMNPYPEDRSVIVCDNASVHHMSCIKRLVEFYGCRIIFLAPYSPDHNPAEKVFSKMKAMLKRAGPRRTLPTRILNALAQVTPEDVEGYFRFSNYV